MIHPSSQTDAAAAANQAAPLPERQSGTGNRATIPLVTLFTLPKPFGQDDHVDLIQHNALRSWLQLSPVVEVLVLGDEPGVRETAVELGANHVPGLKLNESGTPLVSSAFELAHQHSQTPLLAYCNADVILVDDFVKCLQWLMENQPEQPFVLFGRRLDTPVERPLNFESRDATMQWISECHRRGSWSSQVCKEYFVFRRGLYQTMPDFAVGRGNWDNWMIHHAKSIRVKVINAGSRITAIHQNHDYAHTGQGRFHCYVSGEEAQRNQKLAGGRHLISGSVGTHRLTRDGIRRELPLAINPAFWSDVPRFARLMFQLLRS